MLDKQDSRLSTIQTTQFYIIGEYLSNNNKTPVSNKTGVFI